MQATQSATVSQRILNGLEDLNKKLDDQTDYIKFIMAEITNRLDQLETKIMNLTNGKSPSDTDEEDDHRILVSPEENISDEEYFRRVIAKEKVTNQNSDPIDRKGTE
jgi:hypothetical protein